VLSVAVIVIIGLALFWVSQRLIRELISGLQELKAGTEIIGSGYLDHRIVVAGNDELGGLAQSFNRMTDSLKDGNDDLRSFIYSLSHDLKSPLVNLRGFSGELGAVVRELDDLLRRSRVSPAGQDRIRLTNILENDIPATLGFIGTSTERINDQVNAVLKLSLVGQAKLKPERIDMTDLFRSAENRVAGELARKNAVMNIEELPWVVADRKAMREIIGHLLDNAIKYLEPGRPGLVTVSGQRVEGGSLIKVRDNGRGIAEEDLERIFGLFRRAGQQDILGDGMGLAYVKALVRRHNGRIWCESQIGVGTTFSLSVPDVSVFGERSKAR
jgi:signal transduction histidine kinase